MRFSRPSTGTVLGAIALFVALGGTALAATGTVVNIADPTNAANLAHVNPAGALQTTGSVTNTVTVQIAPPSAYIHTTTFAVTSTRGCLVLATPPAGKAMVVREARVDVFGDPTPGPDQDITIYSDTTCTKQVADVNPGTVGETVLPFDPGLGIPANSGLSARATGAAEAEVYTDAYSVPSGSVPAIAATPSKGQPQQKP
jgi:hypothetical protein